MMTDAPSSNNGRAGQTALRPIDSPGSASDPHAPLNGPQNGQEER